METHRAAAKGLAMVTRVSSSPPPAPPTRLLPPDADTAAFGSGGHSSSWMGPLGAAPAPPPRRARVRGRDSSGSLMSPASSLMRRAGGRGRWWCVSSGSLMSPASSLMRPVTVPPQRGFRLALPASLPAAAAARRESTSGVRRRVPGGAGGEAVLGWTGTCPRRPRPSCTTGTGLPLLVARVSGLVRRIVALLPPIRPGRPPAAAAPAGFGVLAACTLAPESWSTARAVGALERFVSP
jgi:hypothetical protein